ncbi:MAG: hypothetical protein AC479_05710 [miscellaneous Crenarchaeota group-6 archaeon AD8-1]|nr:MAG: hypothetical protein AC479_05710 [miscellaneous Crenarchaeota group-6 archaeon AD8-1]
MVIKNRKKMDKTKYKKYHLLKELIEAGNKGKTPRELYRDGNGVFGKNRNYLFAILKELIASEKIICQKISHKNRIYKVKFEDEKILELLAKSYKENEEAIKSNIALIKNLSNRVIAPSFFEFILYNELFSFLQNLEFWILVEDKWKDTAYDILLKYNIEVFSQMILTCIRYNPNVMENTMKKVITHLKTKKEQQQKSIWNKKGELLIDIN